MGRALWRRLPVQRRRAREEVGVRLLAELRLRRRPLAHVPVDFIRARFVRGPRGVRIRGRRIVPEELLGLFAELALRTRLERVSRGARRRGR